MSRLNCGLLLVVLFLLVCASQARAEFTLTKGVTLRQEYNDNVNLDADDEEDDFITIITPHIGLTWSVRDIDVSLNLSLDIKEYWNNTEDDTIDANADEASTLDSTFDLYQGIVFLRIADTFSRVTIDEGGKGGEGNNVTNQTNSNRLIVNPYLLYAPASTLRFKLGYSYENQWYQDDDGDDAEEHVYNLVITKDLTERVTATLSGSHRQYRPKDVAETVLLGEEGNYEYDEDTVRFGLTYLVTEKLSVAGGYGHSWLDYDVREDSDSDIWDASAVYEISSTLSTGIAYQLSYTVSVEDGPSESGRLTAYLAYADRNQVRLTLFSTSEDYVEIDRDNDSWGGDLGGTIPFGDRTGLTWGVRYTTYDETGIEAEEYDRYGARLALYYDISMGRLSTGWTGTRNQSDLDDEDYTNNIVYLQANLNF